MRTPVFELHIKPLFRQTDREQMMMAGKFDLWDYDQVRANIDLIIERAAIDMPPPKWGGPMPSEIVQMFTRWRDTGFKRLQFGTGQYLQATSGTIRVLKATGNAPAGSVVWLEWDAMDATTRYFSLRIELPDGAENPPVAFSCQYRFLASDTRALVVTDAQGRHQV